MCGEHRYRTLDMEYNPGSSPHVRGARVAAHDNANPIGIIPACAGSTSVYRCVHCRDRDHPRMCGEHDAVPELSACDSGSSPHVRGAPSPARTNSYCSGIIPACAGSTPRSRHVNDDGWDHPRMCGEHSHGGPGNGPNLGSSPHVRGARAYDAGDGSQVGIIPACAGSTHARGDSNSE